MLHPAEVEAISRELISLRGTARQIEPLSRRHAGFDLSDAYEIVARVRDLRVAAGETPVGRKIGFTNRALWQAKGISAPIWNYMYDRTVTAIAEAGGSMDPTGMAEPRIEPEVVLHLRAAPQAQMSVSGLLDCLDWVAPAFEVVCSVFPGWEFKAADAAAAFGVHGALFVGRPLEVASCRSTLADTLRALTVELRRDDGLRRTGAGRDVLGGPLDALGFLVDELSRIPTGEPLKAGEIVTTGTLTEDMPLHRGEIWSARFEGIDFQPARLAIV